MVIWLCELKAVKVNHHPANFGGHMHYFSGDIMVLYCHVVSEDHGIEGHVTLLAGTHQSKLLSS